MRYHIIGMEEHIIVVLQIVTAVTSSDGFVVTVKFNTKSAPQVVLSILSVVMNYHIIGMEEHIAVVLQIELRVQPVELIWY